MKKRAREVDLFPDEVLIDSKNLANLNEHQLEGRFDMPLSNFSYRALIVALCALVGIFTLRLWYLQIHRGEEFRERSENNRLEHTKVFAERGIITDRYGTRLAWNVPLPDQEFAGREYTTLPGVAHVLGFIRYPAKDSTGNYFRSSYEGVDGVEREYNTLLTGRDGLKVVEVNARGVELSESRLEPPQDGKTVTLSLDAELTSMLHTSIRSIATEVGYRSGSAILMDIHTGEILALTNYPEYNPNVLMGRASSTGSYATDPLKPFLNRAIDGGFTPGSIMKPYVAYGALTEKIIKPEKAILSTGSISIPNIYNPGQVSVFNDWKAHGWVDMRRAIAVSSNVYFYEVGGGFEDQKGLGITKLSQNFRLFGFGSPVASQGYFAGVSGTVPDPAWKAKNFDNDPWRLGDTYFTSIGQYGFQVSPLQVVRAVGAIANGGTLVAPTLIRGDADTSGDKNLGLNDDYLQIVREGMRMTITDGSAKSLNVPYVKIAGKTGTAEVGVRKGFVNTWIEGFFPYDNPQYAYVVMMERGPDSTHRGAVSVMIQAVRWIYENRPAYFGLKPKAEVVPVQSTSSKPIILPSITEPIRVEIE